MGFHWSLSDSKASQVSRTLLSILAVLNNEVVWMVSNHPHISKSSSLSTILIFPNRPVPLPVLWWLYWARRLQLVSPSPLCSIVSSAPKQGPGTYLSLLSLSFTLWSAETARPIIRLVLFCCCWESLGQVVWPRLGVPFVSQNPREFCAFHYPGRIPIFHLPFVRMVKFQFLVQFPVDYLPHPVVSTLFALFYCIRL